MYLEGDLDAAGTEYLRATIAHPRQRCRTHHDRLGRPAVHRRAWLSALIGSLRSPDGTDEATLVGGTAIGRIQHLLALAGCGFDCEECNFSL